MVFAAHMASFEAVDCIADEDGVYCCSYNNPMVIDRKAGPGLDLGSNPA